MERRGGGRGCREVGVLARTHEELQFLYLVPLLSALCALTHTSTSCTDNHQRSSVFERPKTKTLQGGNINTINSLSQVFL